MKKLLLLLPFLISCVQAEKHDDIKKYLSDKYPNHYIEIISVEERDSVFDPFNDLRDLYLGSVLVYADVAALHTAAFNEDRNRNLVKKLKEAEKIHAAKMDSLFDVFTKYAVVTEIPFYDSGFTPNSVAYIVKFKANGEETADVLLLDNDGFSTVSFNMETLEKIKDQLTKNAEAGAEIIRDRHEFSPSKDTRSNNQNL